ncbi:MAG: PAS domain S-box protein [Proteobacteria bacterium]|nr:PAS domain S-box protein [Pseudomonadota bacterium]
MLAYLGATLPMAWFVEHAAEAQLRSYAMAMPWLSTGVGVAGLLIGGERLWPALSLGAALFWGAYYGHPPVTVGFDALGEGLATLLTVRLLALWGFRRDFDRFRDPLVLIAAAVVGRSFATTVDVAGLVVATELAPGSLSAAYLGLVERAPGGWPAITPELAAISVRWTLNTIAGTVLVVPVLGGARDELRAQLRQHPARLLGWALALLAWSAIALGLPWQALSAPLLVVALALVTSAAAGLGVAAAAITTLALSLVATVGFALRVGVLGAGLAATDLEFLWGFIGLLTLTGLLLTALLAERRRERERLAQRAQRNLALFRDNPSWLWVVDAATGRILLANDAAIIAHGYSLEELRGMTLASLATGLRRPGDARALAGEHAGVATLVQQRTKAGRLIDVELLATPIELDGRPVVLWYGLDVTDRYALRSQLFASTDLERRRLAQELHDGLGQVLTGLNLGAQAAATRAQRGQALDRDTAEFLLRASHDATQLCTELMRGASALDGEQGDLAAALRRLPESLPPGPGPRLTVEAPVDVPASVSLARREHLYRIAQEALANAQKHAQAREVRVVLAAHDGEVRLAIEDDGIGIGPAADRLGGFGLRSMDMRANAAGGRLEIATRAGGGTRIEVHCPAADPGLPVVTIDDSPEAPEAPEAPATASPAADAGAGRARALGAWLLTCLSVATACFLGLLASSSLGRIIDPRVAMAGPRFAVPSLLGGIAASALLVGGRRLWPGVALGAGLGSLLLIHLPLSYSAWYGLATAFGIATGVRLLEHWDFHREFDRWRDPAVLLAAALAMFGTYILVSWAGVFLHTWWRPGSLGPLVDPLITDAAGRTPVVTGRFLAALSRWFTDGVAGVVLVVPALVARPPLWQAGRGRRLEWLVFAGVLGAWIAALLALDDPGARWPLVSAALALLLWAAVRFGVASAAASTLTCAIAATLSFAHQVGALRSGDVDEGISALWAFLALLVVTGSVLTALLAERNRTVAELAASAERYRRLFEHDPHPLWVEDRATGRVRMANAEAVRRYGYREEEWLELSTDRLAVDPPSPLPAGGQDGRERMAVRHRTRAGTLLEVELSRVPIDFEGEAAFLCFAVDVTERNGLRRAFLHSTDQERRRLGAQIRAGLGRTLAELGRATARFQEGLREGRLDPAAIEAVAMASREATAACRRLAHTASPIQVNSGNLVNALLELKDEFPEARTTRIAVDVRGAAQVRLPLEKREHLYGLVRSAVGDAALERAAREVRVSVELAPSVIRVSIADDGQAEVPPGRASAVHLMGLRATSMGARLRHGLRSGGGRLVVCECPQQDLAA